MKNVALALAAGAVALAACGGNGNGTTGATGGSVSTTGTSSTTASASTTATTATSTSTSTSTSGQVTTSGTGSTSSGTSGAASSSGSTTGGGGACVTADGGSELSACETNTDCGCPLICAYDSVQGGLVCVFPCTDTTADCPDPVTHCVSGACTTNLCAADGGTLYGPCNADDTGDGICQSGFDFNFNIVGECQQTGSAALGAMCTQDSPRDAGAAAFCTQGTDCEAQLDGGEFTLCTAVCDPTSPTNQCGGGDVCAPDPLGSTLQDGVCVTTGVGGCAEGVGAGITFGQVCTTSAGCGCPQNCVNDPVQGQLQCSVPCEVTATDCSDPTTSCQNGFCVGNACAGDAGPFFTICNASTDAGDGYCQPVVNNNFNNPQQVGVCYQTGTADSGFGCDPAALRFDAGQLCVQGTVCYAPDGGNAYCEHGCDPTDANDCGAGDVCAVNYTGTSSRGGVCYVGGPGGCAEGLTEEGFSTEQVNCATSGYCGCPQTCIPDPGSGAALCELPCTSASDCDMPTTACLNGSCAPNYCAVNPLGATVPGAYDAPCTVSDAGDGTCQAQYPAISFFGDLIPLDQYAYGLCQLDGTVTIASVGSCNETQSADLGLLCQADSECFTVNQNTGQTACIGLCDPTAFDGGSCGAGNGCFAFYQDFEGFPVALTYGICQPCLQPTSDAGVGCFSDSECCSQRCVGGSDGGICE